MKKKMKIPHTFALLFYFLIVIMVLTYIVPAGNFQRVVDEASGVETVVPGTFQFTGEQTPVNPFQLFVCIQKGFVESGSVIFLLFLLIFVFIQLQRQNLFTLPLAHCLKRLEGMIIY